MLHTSHHMPGSKLFCQLSWAEVNESLYKKEDIYINLKYLFLRRMYAFCAKKNICSFTALAESKLGGF